MLPVLLPKGGRVKLRSVLAAGVSLVGLAALVVVQGVGVGGVPPLGQALDPATGVMNLGSRAGLPQTGSIALGGLGSPVTVGFSKDGIASISGKSQLAVYQAIGYVEARNRLFQMDLIRREAAGNLAAILGPSYLASDLFELRLGLVRTAERNLAALPPASLAILKAFSAGVNDAISYDKTHNALPTAIRLLGYTPAPWTPLDSMLVQGFMTQMLDYTQTPVDYSIMISHVGFAQTMKLFPIIAPNAQNPYDPGPYHFQGTIPPDPAVSISPGLKTALGQLQAQAAALPPFAIHTFSNSNNWAVSGSRTANGRPLLAGDPHLQQTLPSIWYWLSASAPGLHFSGVTVPGLPVILIGRNRNIVWSLTNVENQATFFYNEKTSSSHPGRYFYNGSWVRYHYYHYTVAVKGKSPVSLTVPVAAQGPVMTVRGATVAVDWLGNHTSPDLTDLIGVTHATNWSQFKAAISSWFAPTQNWAFADSSGQIGLMSPGGYPVFRHGDPWTVMSGTGASDIAGYIPPAAQPQVYNPPAGYVFTANQRPVSASYPYYIGTSWDFYTNGYRADEIKSFLAAHPKLTTVGAQQLQNSVTDYLATKMVPWLVATVNSSHPTPQVAAATALLARWNDQMTVSSPAAAIWWTLLTNDLKQAFGPWFKGIPQPPNSALDLNQTNSALIEDLQVLNLNHARFTPPGSATPLDAAVIARSALTATVSQLAKQLGPVSKWSWGRLHSREFTSLTGAASLAYGPRSSSGDTWTVDAADGLLLSEAGPSWRMIVNFGGQSRAIYPGGQSENPLSPWYGNQIPYWWNGRYLAFGLNYGRPIATWTLEPRSA